MRLCEIDLTKDCIPPDWPDQGWEILEEYWEDSEEWIIVRVSDPVIPIPEEWLI